MIKVVTMGGGGGHAQVLKSLKHLTNVAITAICPSTDSGGSTGILRRDYGAGGYLGDVTKCLGALAVDEELAAALAYRFSHGSLSGHSIRNILLFGLEQTLTIDQALKKLSNIYQLKDHQVLPVTQDKTELCASLQLGNKVVGEASIDQIASNPLWNPSVHAIADIYLNPPVKAGLKVIKALKEAEFIVVCPGDLYSSIIPTLLPQGIKKTIVGSSAKVIVFINIMTKKGETDDYTASDFVTEIETKLGRPADYIVCNNKPIPEEVALRYSLENKVVLNTINEDLDPRAIMAPLAVIDEHQQIMSDPKVIYNVLTKIIKQK
jgi:uncharacterized cofD-like protein